jgi:defect-in-organelle-trafficking protein DotD
MLVSMKYNMAQIAICSFLLSACASTPQPPPPNVNATEASLAEASYAVSRSVVDIAETVQAAHPIPKLGSAPSPIAYGMGGITTVDWSGPIQPLLHQLAKSSNYRLVVLGTPPAIPVLVTIYQRNVMLGDIVRDIGYQAGERATVVVYPDSRAIELRYAKN